MPGPTSPFWRVVRSAACAVATGYLAALGHLLGGGALPDAATLLPVAALVGLAVGGLARHRGSLVGIAAVVVAAQLAFHAIFSITAHAGHGVAGPSGGAARMVLFHLIGAALTVLLLHRGEESVFRMFAALRRALPAIVLRGPAVAVGPTWFPRTVDRPETGAGAAPLPRAHGRRGPPTED